MKTNVRRQLTVVAVGAILSAGLPLARPDLLADGPPTGLTHEWGFESAANPAANTGPSARALIAPGDFASGWISGDPSLGSVSGVWDLGSRGTITLSDSAGLTGPSALARRIKVKVLQWRDETIFPAKSEVTVPGATLSGSESTVKSVGSLGRWLEDETSWVVDAGTPVESIVVTSPSSGAMIDQVLVQVERVVAGPVPLSIVAVGGGEVELSWLSPEAGWVIEGNSDLNNSGGWAPVGAPVTVVGNRYSAQVASTNPMHFFRLRKP